MTASAIDSVRAAARGDLAAFSALVRAETPAAYRIAFSITRSASEAEDAVQEAFLRAWRDIGGLREPDSWSGWFRRLLVRAAIDQTSRRRRVREVDLDWAAELPSSERGLPPTDRIELMRALGRLSAEDRALLTLRFFLDLQVEDVAAALKIPVGTAKSRLHRATDRLRAQMRLEP